MTSGVIRHTGGKIVSEQSDQRTPWWWGAPKLKRIDFSEAGAPVRIETHDGKVLIPVEEDLSWNEFIIRPTTRHSPA